MRGIDVSHHQQAEDIDWARLKDEHEIEFCYIRASYGSRVDAEALEHAEACEKVGILYGFYHFFRHHQDPNAQLGAFTSVVEKADPQLVPVLDLEANKYDPNVTDWELYGAHAYNVGSQLSEDAFVLYISPGWYEKLSLFAPWLSDKELPLWIAHWDVVHPRSPREHALWQRGVKTFSGVPYELDFNEGEPPRIEKAKPLEDSAIFPLNVNDCLYVWPDGSLRLKKWKSGE